MRVARHYDGTGASRRGSRSSSSDQSARIAGGGVGPHRVTWPSPAFDPRLADDQPVAGRVTNTGSSPRPSPAPVLATGLPTDWTLDDPARGRAASATCWSTSLPPEAGVDGDSDADAGRSASRGRPFSLASSRGRHPASDRERPPVAPFARRRRPPPAPSTTSGDAGASGSPPTEPRPWVYPRWRDGPEDRRYGQVGSLVAGASLSTGPRHLGNVSAWTRPGAPSAMWDDFKRRYADGRAAPATCARSSWTRATTRERLAGPPSRRRIAVSRRRCPTRTVDGRSDPRHA